MNYDYDTSLAETLEQEGGYSNDPGDPGGPTKYGITQRDMPGVNIAEITPQQATAYYLQNYIKPYYTQIQEQIILNKLEDMGVLFGIQTAVKMLQIAAEVEADGDFGPESLHAVNSADAVALLAAFKTQ